MRVLSDPNSGGAGSKLLLLDLDFFKKVNDLYGHVVGDEVLKRVADVIRRSRIPEGSCCARLGGDEFAVLVPPTADKSTSIRLSPTSSARLPNPDAWDRYGPCFGLGRDFSHRARNDAEECLRRSDIAMYAAKRAGRNCMSGSTTRWSANCLARTQLEDEIRAPSRRASSCLSISRKWTFGTSQLTGFEVLARWRSPTEGIARAGRVHGGCRSFGNDFGAVAERHGPERLLEAREWPGHLKIAVNISPIQFSDPHLAERILKLLDGMQFSAFAARGRNHRIFVPRRPGDCAHDRGEPQEHGRDHLARRFRHRLRVACPSCVRSRSTASRSTRASSRRLLSDSQSDAIVTTILSLGKRCICRSPPKASRTMAPRIGCRSSDVRTVRDGCSERPFAATR